MFLSVLREWLIMRRSLRYCRIIFCEFRRMTEGITITQISYLSSEWDTGTTLHVSYASCIWCATPRRGLSWQKVQIFIQLLVQIEYKLGLNRNYQCLMISGFCLALATLYGVQN